MRFWWILWFLMMVFVGNAQEKSLRTFDYPRVVRLDAFVPSQYPFIHFDRNYFKFYSDESPNWEHFYRNLKTMIAKKDRKLNLYHIGGSHIQADIYTHDFRSFLQTNWPGLSGERGLVFPFGLAKTNNPSNYNFSSPNHWTAYKSVNQRPEDVVYGLTGAVIKCTDSIALIKFKFMRTVVSTPFDRLRIHHNTGGFPFELNFDEHEILIDHVESQEDLGYTDIFFTDNIDSIDIQFVRQTTKRIPLEIYGFEFLNNLPGFTYNAIGINGAGLYTFLANDHFLRDLKVHPPDFFAFSLGTNDGYTSVGNFDPLKYKDNLERMILKVLEVNPKCAILLTVPNDCYLHGKTPNKNTARQREVIIELAEKYQFAVWDFYGIMGELGSSMTWKNHGLMRSDLVHFSSEGYHLKGNLLIDAFLKFINQFDQFYR